MERVNLRRLPDDWGADEEALLQAVDDATATPIYIEYSLAPEWFDGTDRVIDEFAACVTKRPDPVRSPSGSSTWSSRAISNRSPTRLCRTAPYSDRRDCER